MKAQRSYRPFLFDSPFSLMKVWLLAESTMRCFFLLLFLEGFLCHAENSLILELNSLFGWQGSCILILCQIKETYSTHSLNNSSLIPYFEPSYNEDYTDTMLYDDSRASQNHLSTTIPSLQEQATFTDAPKGVELIADPGTTVREGEKLSLECTVKSSNPAVLEFQWWKNNHKTAGRITGNRMEIGPLGRQHSGRYRCKARNRFGTAESEELTIDVQYPPKETKPPFRSRTIKENDTITLECSFIAKPSITKYEWYKKPSSSVISSQKQLHFQAIRPSDSGTYYCQVYNPIGGSNSSLVTLDVLSRVFAIRRRDAGSNKNLHIGLFRRNRFPSSAEIMWVLFKFKDLTESENHRRVGRDLGGLLVQPPAQGRRSHSIPDRWLSNLFLKTSTDGVPATLGADAPKGVELSADPGTTLREGEKLSLECMVKSSNPAVLDYQWWKNDHRIYEGIYRNSMEIGFVGRQHSGRYRCGVRNRLGTVESEELTIDVQYAPEEPNISFSRSTIQGKDAISLHCWSTACPPITHYEWYKCPALNIISSQMELHFQAIQPNDSGGYYCKAYNPIGQSTSSVLTLNIH